MREKIQFAFILISSTVASLGTYPYAKDFSASIFDNHHLSVLVASILVPAAVSANIALGTYSLQNTLIQTKKVPISHTIFIVVISLLSAFSTGFICFVGYKTRFPFFLNLLISTMVVIVNTGIGFSAINSALADISSQTGKKTQSKKLKPMKLVLSIVTVISALMVTLTVYLASTHGLTMLINNLPISNESLQKLVYPLAVLIWFPGAVLFANGSRITVLRIYDRLRSKRINFSSITVFTILIAFASGSAYAQMALEFFDVCKNIPDFFKRIAEHYTFIFYFFMPIAFMISAIVNGYVLDKLIKQYR